MPLFWSQQAYSRQELTKAAQYYRPFQIRINHSNKRSYHQIDLGSDIILAASRCGDDGRTAALIPS
jgi:hypothetical protein